MSMVKISVAHDLSQEKAVRRVQGLLAEVVAKCRGRVSGLHEEWNGNTDTFRFSVDGFPVSGTIAVSDTAIQVPPVIPRAFPLALRIFMSRFNDNVFEEARQILTKAERIHS